MTHHLKQHSRLRFLLFILFVPSFFVYFVEQIPFADLFPSASEAAIDLLEGLLVFDPPGRLTVDEALDNPYFEPLR